VIGLVKIVNIKYAKMNIVNKTIDNIETAYYNIKNGIYNLIRWFPVIWKLRDFEAHYLYILIYKHLDHVESSFKKQNHIVKVNSEEYINQIKTAKNLAKKLFEGDYLDIALKPVEEKYGKAKLRFEDVDSGKFKKMIFDETKEEANARYEAYKLADDIEAQDKELLFKYLREYIAFWWV